ncbi:MAG: metallohydrolase [Candidatus Gracilibacteria bacterium]|jgi:hypothetical protein
MSSKIEFFPVDNGDMTLISLESGKKILIDVHIRDISADENIPDVAKMLRERLSRDSNNRLYVDVFLLSHPDKDHLGGLSDNFHLGSLETWNEDEDKIIIREMWSSPIIFRQKSRVSDQQGLAQDAMDWWNEARRRIKAYRDNDGLLDGNRILVLGDDIEEKTKGLDDIRIAVGDSFNTICGTEDSTFSADLFGPIPAQGDEEDEDALAKNRSSVITRFHIASSGNQDKCLFLSGGDAEVLVWEHLWDMFKDIPEKLSYDLLQTPHHCSFHSLSHDSWSEMGKSVTISDKARNALGQARSSASIVASCKPISDDDNDPPCVRAEREYKKIAEEVGGEFLCTMAPSNTGKPDVLVFKIDDDNSEPKSYPSSGPITPIVSRLKPPTGEFDKKGGGRYA